MGCYTELILGCSLSKDTPKVCIDAIDYVINGEHKQPKYDNPKNWQESDYNLNYFDRTMPEEDITKFLKEYDLYTLFGCSSFYFGAASPTHRFEYCDADKTYKISTRANLKNSSGRIEKFLEYIKPYVVQGSGFSHHIYASVQFEDEEFPTFYAIDGVYKNPLYTNQLEVYRERIKNLYLTFSKLYDGICPDWSITDKDYEERGKPIPTEDEVQAANEALEFDEAWDWMADHILKNFEIKKKHQKKEKKK